MSGLKKLGESLLGIAPTLANALLPGVGGVVAGSAVKAVSAALGTKEDPQALATVLNQGLGPEALKALKEADSQFAIRMKELDVDVMRIHADDRASARRMQTKTKSLTAPSLAGVTMVAFILCIAGVFYLAVDDQPLDPTVATLVGAVVGYASAKADQVIAFFFGSSESGNDATAHLADAANGRK